MALPLLFEQITLENLFSFKKTTVQLRGLNVLIGANAVGKSNLVEAIGLLHAAPTDLSTAIRRLGGVRVVCSLAGPNYSPISAIECSGMCGEALRYRLEFSEEARGFVILKERLGGAHLSAGDGNGMPYFERIGGNVRFGAESSPVPLTQSVFQVYKSPADATPITRVGRELESIRIYREFRTTGDSQARVGAGVSSPPAWNKFLHDGGDNLALVLLDMDFKSVSSRIRAYLQRFCDRFTDLKVRLDGSIAKTYIEETGLLEPLVSWRLSDGTLKFLCLLAVFLDPDVAPLICIEEPEVGLHPDAIQIIAEALVEASERTQLIVTTHSEALIDALSEHPEHVLVAERDFENGTQFKRLNEKQLSSWLERYTLGALWRKG